MSWGGHRAYYWFETFVTIPEEMDGQCIVYEQMTGKEDGWDATNPQFTIYVNDVLKQGLDINHREVLLTEHAKAGERYRIMLSAFTRRPQYESGAGCPDQGVAPGDGEVLL